MANCITQKLGLIAQAYLALFSVDSEFELGFNKVTGVLHHPNACLLAAYIDVAVICITNKFVAPGLQLLVQFVQNNVR